MTYRETCEYLYNQIPMFEKQGASGYKEGLANTLALDEHFGHPHLSFATIHVAGTNGKGSVSHSLAAILQESGYKVGLYTSPHLVDFRERIRINGEPISEEYVVNFVEQERSFFEPLCPSFFEVTTALAFKYFKDMNVDIAVVEVGLGGRLDCTNIITPLISVITNISFDHTQFLGDTLEKIAGEKAGIMKKNIPAIIGETIPETRRVFIRKAQETGVPLTFAEDTPLVLQSTPDYTNGGINYQTSIIKDLHGELGGLCQEKNTNTILHAVIALQKLGLNISSGNIRDGFGSVCETSGLRGRWQVISETPKTVCDTGHNEGGFRYITEQLKKQDCKHLRIIFGMVSDKDITAVLRMLPQEAIYYFTQADTARALSAEEMARQAALFNLRGKTYLSVSEAYRAAKADASNDDFIYIGGSTFIVADFLAAYNA